MGRSYLEILLSNIIIVVALIPMVVLLNSIMVYDSNPLFWIIVSSLLIGLLSYLSWVRENGSKNN